ncbi:MAG: hypothetical protein Barrevirus4_13 [Barrevirus sp.]|uniref:Uncharacterized protein n=1 Tax=Barrevirus sp. TaxID=2487763 RepID=A0A3G4ZU26_9VIRU|nr:MAG: hypothetical protein Barrevirus4_13 [Barrevirus sp.]
MSVGSDIAVRSLIATTSSVTNLISYLTTNKSSPSDISSILISLDLEFTIKIIEELVKDWIDKEVSEPVRIAIIGVQQIVELINKELNEIKGAIEYHNSKYFKGWRSFTWSNSPDIIKNHSITLKSRYTMLFELLKIYM